MEKTPTTNPRLTITRVFRATPERLWSYWTDPTKYAKWLNPNGTLVVHEFDVREGGRVRFDMPQPDGSRNPQEGVFHKLDPHRELVTGDADRAFLITARFEPVDAAHTRLTIVVDGMPPEHFEMATTGWNMGLDKLQGELLAPVGGFAVERSFRAAPEKVWAMWTTKDGLERWFCPDGYTCAVTRLDVREGGGFAIELVHPEHTVVNRSTYTRVRPTSELGWTWHFDIFLKPGETPYDVPIFLTLERTPTGGTRMRFVQGGLRTPEFTEGSRQGVLSNFSKLAKALGE